MLINKVIAVVLIFAMVTPTVLADETNTKLEFIANPQQGNYTAIVNIADKNNSWLNDIDKYHAQGRIIDEGIAPSPVELYNSTQSKHVYALSYGYISSKEIMSGASQIVFRLPLAIKSDPSQISITTKIYEIQSNLVKIISYNQNGVEIDTPGNILEMEGSLQYVKITYPANITYNNKSQDLYFLYARVNAPIEPNAYYIVYTKIHHNQVYFLAGWENATGYYGINDKQYKLNFTSPLTYMAISGMSSNIYGVKLSKGYYYRITQNKTFNYTANTEAYLNIYFPLYSENSTSTSINVELYTPNLHVYVYDNGQYYINYYTTERAATFVVLSNADPANITYTWHIKANDTGREWSGTLDTYKQTINFPDTDGNNWTYWVTHKNEDLNKVYVHISTGVNNPVSPSSKEISINRILDLKPGINTYHIFHLLNRSENLSFTQIKIRIQGQDGLYYYGIERKNANLEFSTDLSGNYKPYYYHTSALFFIALGYTNYTFVNITVPGIEVPIIHYKKVYVYSILDIFLYVGAFLTGGIGAVAFLTIANLFFPQEVYNAIIHPLVEGAKFLINTVMHYAKKGIAIIAPYIKQFVHVAISTFEWVGYWFSIFLVFFFNLIAYGIFLWPWIVLSRGLIAFQEQGVDAMLDYFSSYVDRVTSLMSKFIRRGA